MGGSQEQDSNADQRGGGTSKQDSLVREHIVNVEELQGLPDTLMLIVEPQAGDLQHLPKGNKTVRGADFNPTMGP